jgi:D-alanyl-D-alanine carboxypeptidase
MPDAEDRGWGPGWPTTRVKDMSWITVRGVTCPNGVHKLLAPTVTYLIEETLRRGYKLVPGWCWGYACRPIRGTARASNHSWGLAVDLNAPTNPMKSPLTTDMPEWMVQLWKNHGFVWGGDYTGRKDAMHFEFVGTPQDARLLAPKHKTYGKIEEADVDAKQLRGDRLYACRVGKGVVVTNEFGEIYAWNTSYHGGYNALKPEQRQGNFDIVGIEPDFTNAPDGYVQLRADGGQYYWPMTRVPGYNGP